MLPSPNGPSSSYTWMSAHTVARGNRGCGEEFPLLPKPGSRASMCRLTQSAPRTESAVPAATTSSSNLFPHVAVSSLLVGDSLKGGGSTFGDGGSGSDGNGSAGGSSDANGGAGGGNGGLAFGAAPASLSEFLRIFAYAVRLQSWASWLLAVVFHLFHLLLILSFWSSPILYRSTFFSQSMAKSLLEAQSVRQHRRGSDGCSNNGRTRLSAAAGKGPSGAEAAALLRSSESPAPVSVESVWAIHDSVFFLEEGRAVMPTAIASSFSSLGGKNHHGGTTRSTSYAGRDVRDSDDADHSTGNDAIDSMSQGKPRGSPHTCILSHKPGGDAGRRGGAQKTVVSATAVSTLREATGAAAIGQSNQLRPTVSWDLCSKDEDRHRAAATSDGPGLLRWFAGSPPVAPEHTLSQRKNLSHGLVALSQIIDAWAASPLYSSPLALALLYHLYGVACVILLLTVTDGMLTGHFSALRLCIALAELLWYIRHGAHAFLIYCWMLVLSHWPHRTMCSADDAAFLQQGTPYAVVTKRRGQVSMFWFYRAALAVDGGAEGGGGHGGAGKLLVDEINLPYYLYDQVWYLKPLAEGIEVFYVCLLLLCLVKDFHRVLDAVVGVRELMEPEGCVRCPLCGELMVLYEQRSLLRANSIYEPARGCISWSGWRMRWWWRWLRSPVQGSCSGHRVPTPPLPSPLWRWLLPARLGGGPLKTPLAVSATAGAPTDDGDASLTPGMGDETTFTLAEILEDVEFYEQSAVRRSAAAPQDTTTEATAHLTQWLRAMPCAARSPIVRVQDGEHSRSRARNGGFSAEQDEENAAATAGALALGLSASSSSEECVSAGLVTVAPAAAPATPDMGAATAPAHGALTAFAKAGPPNPSPTHLVASSIPASPTRRRHGRRSQGRLQRSLNSSQQSMTPRKRLQRRTRFTEEVLYWNRATRHVHHRCPRLYLDAQEATDDEDDDGSDGGSASCECSSEASSATSSTAATPTSGSLTRPATTASARAHAVNPLTAVDYANFHQGVLHRSLSPRAGPGGRAAGTGRFYMPQLSAELDEPSRVQEKRLQQQSQQCTASHQGTSAADDSTHQRNDRIIGPDFSEAPSKLFAQGPPPQSAAKHIVERGLYDPNKAGEDEFRPGNAFQSYDRAGYLSRLTHSWLNPLLKFGLLEPTLLRQERFLPSLPEELLSLDNIAMPAWRLWVYRKVWFAAYVAKPGELLIPGNEAMNRAEEELMSLAHLHEADRSESGEETESLDGRQTAVMLGHTSFKQAAKFRPQRPRRCWQESLLWALSAPVRCILVTLFYHVYIGTSRTVRRTRRRLARELLKDRLSTAAENLYDPNGYQTVESSEAIEEATWALTEVASSCGSSAAAPSVGSALPTHMRRQLALSDVSLYYLFLEHRCGRRFLLVAAPLLLLSELLTVAVVPVLELLTMCLQRVDSDMVPHRREAPSDQSSVTEALLCANLLGVLLLLQGVVHSAYVGQAQQAAMEARTCVCAVVLEKTLALPLAQRTFTEAEVVALATEEAMRVATCLRSLHLTWSCPLRVALLLLLLANYVGWVAAAVAGAGSLLTVPLLRHSSREVRQRRHEARETAAPRIALLQRALRHIRKVKAMLLEGRLAHWLRKARATEASRAEAVAMAEGTAGMLAGGVECLLMVAALGAECVLSAKELRDMDVQVPALAIFVLLTMPLLEVPALFSVVARGFLAMKRIEAYLRQRPDEFAGTWVDLTSFTATQQQLRVENPGSTLLNYRRGSVVCRNSFFTWQHDLTEEPPSALLRDVDFCIRPGQLVVVQGSMGAGKSTLLLSILGEVNLFVSSGCSTNGSSTGYRSEKTLSVVSATEAAALAPVYTGGAPGAVGDGNRRDPGPAAAAACPPAFPTPPSNSISLADAAALGIFVASPMDSAEARRCVSAEQTLSAVPGADAAAAQRALAGIASTAAAAAAAAKTFMAAGGASPGGYARSEASKLSARSLADDRASVCSVTTKNASQLSPTGLEGDDSSTGGFLVFGSCAYCAEVPWLQNDTIRANIVPGGGPVLERWYCAVLRACALSAEVTALPHGDATVIGERGELLSLSMRCRIAIARAVYSKSHVYLMDSVLSPLEPAIQEHIIREVFHRLLRKKTIVLASNVGLRSLRPHRVFSVVNGVAREDTDLYTAVSSLHARGDEDDEEALMQRQASDCGGTAADGDDGGLLKRDSSASQAMTPPLPALYAEEFEEPQEAAEAETLVKVFVDDPAVAATTVLFDGDAGFGPRDPRLLGELVDRLDAGISGDDVSLAGSALLAGAEGGFGNSAALRPRRSRSSCPRLPRRFKTGRSGAASGAETPPKEVPLPGTVTTNVASCQPSPYLKAPTAAPSHPAADPGAPLHGVNVDGTGCASDCSEQGSSASAGSGSNSTCSNDPCMSSHYAQLLRREPPLRRRHRLFLFIFLRFMGGQVTWVLLTALLQQGISLCVDIWTAAWLAVMAAHTTRSAVSATRAAVVGRSFSSRVAEQLYTWAAVSDLAFVGVLSALCLLAMLLTLLRARAVYVGAYGTMHFIYNQIACRVLHSPASYFDSRIIALVTRVLRDDGEVAEYRVLSTAETLLSCGAQVVLVALWNAFVNPVFILLLPMAVSIFYHISQRHAVVLREVRRLELGSVNGMTNILREVYEGAPTVRCMALQDRLREEFCRALDTANTASMVAYLTDCWVELRLHVLATLAVYIAATVGVIFTFSYSHPSFTAVAVIACLRAGPVLTVMCRSLGAFTAKEWISVQRLMSLWGAPQEPLTLVGEADLYTYSHVRRKATGPFVLEGGDDAPLLKNVRSPTASPMMGQGVRSRQREARQDAKAERCRLRHEQQNRQRLRRQQLGPAGGEDGPAESHAPASLSVFTDDSSPSSSSRERRATGAPGDSCATTLPLLELINVSARYRATLPYVLRHVNLAVFPGERLGVVGHAGQGKRSIFNVLLRLVDVIEGGGVFVDGEDAARIPYPILRSWFGLLSQEPLLVQGSWRSNLLLGYHFAHCMLMDGANGGADHLFLPTTTLACQQLQADARPTSRAAAAVTAQLAAAAGEREPLLQRGATAHTRGGTGAAAGPEDSRASVSAAENSYGSTDSAQPYMQAGGGERAHVGFMHTTADFAFRDQRRTSEDGGSRGGDCGVASMAGAAARRLRDSLTSFQRCLRRRNNSDYNEHILPGSAGGGDGRRRCRSSCDTASNESHPHHLHGHAVKGLRQPVEDAVLWEALRAVGLDAAVELSGGLDAPLVGDDLAETGLTDSQCRLLCLARVVLRRPPIVLLEDAVHSGAEAQTDFAIHRVLANELRESTVLIIAHRMSTLLNLCTRVVAVQGGTLMPIADLGPTLASAVTADAPGAGDETRYAAAMRPATAVLDPVVLKQLSHHLE
ncbi:multi drug resistance protein-like [Leishmania infantum JPCM5]|uniref:Multi drug resistance protein-like n=2 Tax=Leishmania infantum TaxID=5671 RepID=A4I5H8_LEIIN|nr:multi drug resistance protein-like [Leishmania infantum JPCM5]CAC9492010.1 multi_drug_resistance_protein-like [Leishmania infantum]CAM70047.1 multi drug resistance protein-like [Leishmania infantum JPCM5]SUZ42232.1 multi_drug_resistance_protein-like [Leishmania infantum]|eukprot:XP_001466997.1 multi drug resistance protein-like [Leishmania infantum JPCM5]